MLPSSPLQQIHGADDSQSLTSDGLFFHRHSCCWRLAEDLRVHVVCCCRDARSIQLQQIIPVARLQTASGVERVRERAGVQSFNRSLFSERRLCIWLGSLASVFVFSLRVSRFLNPSEPARRRQTQIGHSLSVKRRERWS